MLWLSYDTELCVSNTLKPTTNNNDDNNIIIIKPNTKYHNILSV